MEIVNGNTVYIGDKIKLSVEVGKYGKYVKLFKTRTSGSETWMYLTEPVWSTACSYLGAIDMDSMIGKPDSNGPVFVLTPTKRLELKAYKGLPYISFHNTKTIQEPTTGQSETYQHYINFNHTEFLQLRDSGASRVTHLLTQVVLFGNNEDWHLISDAVSPDVSMSFSLMHCPPPKQMVLMVTGYLMKEKIEELQLKSCHGCSNKSQSQRHHLDKGPGCMSVWADAVLFHAETAVKQIDTAATLTAINKALGWTLADPGTPFADVFGATLDTEECSHKYCETKDKCATDIFHNLCKFLKTAEA